MKTLDCSMCKKQIKIKSHEAGKFWHLTNWTNKFGLKFNGGFCYKCFKKLHNKKH